MWVVSDDGKRLLVWSAAKTWKVRRIRRNPRVLVAPANFRGKERGARIEAAARVIEHQRIDELLRQKYGWQKRALDWFNRRSNTQWATIELSDPPVGQLLGRSRRFPTEPRDRGLLSQVRIDSWQGSAERREESLRKEVAMRVVDHGQPHSWSA